MAQDLWRELFWGGDTPGFGPRERVDLDAVEGANLAERNRALVEHAKGLEMRLARHELLLRTLINWHVSSGDFDAEAFRVLVARNDLADGIEDGVFEPRPERHVDVCVDCGQPLSLSRETCVYCGVPTAKSRLKAIQRRAEANRVMDERREEHEAEQAEARRRAKFVDCAQCGEPVERQFSYFSGNGLICELCYRKVE